VVSGRLAESFDVFPSRRCSPWIYFALRKIAEDSEDERDGEDNIIFAITSSISLSSLSICLYILSVIRKCPHKVRNFKGAKYL